MEKDYRQTIEHKSDKYDPLDLIVGIVLLAATIASLVMLCIAWDKGAW